MKKTILRFIDALLRHGYLIAFVWFAILVWVIWIRAVTG